MWVHYALEKIELDTTAYRIKHVQEAKCIAEKADYMKSSCFFLRHTEDYTYNMNTATNTVTKHQ